MAETLLLSGATGHVGTALLPLLLEDPQLRILALVRARDAAHLAERRETLLGWLPEDFDGSRLDLVRADLAEPNLGMGPEDLERVEGSATSVLHCAASVRFDMPEDTAIQQNMAATEAMLGLARRLADAGRLHRMDHVSTCYVAGDRSGRVLETECDEGQGFRNSYEWSKCQSEKKVRQAQAEGLPVAIHRPSVIVGDSRSGVTRSFNVMYWPLKLYARGWFRSFPGRADCVADIVPVDYVARAMADLRRRPESLGRCFHLAAGDEALSVGELFEPIRSALEGPPLRYVDQRVWRGVVRPLMSPMLLTKRGRAVRRGGNAFLPYFIQNPLFDTSELVDVLGDAAKAPPVTDYIQKVVGFARDQDFGRA